MRLLSAPVRRAQLNELDENLGTEPSFPCQFSQERFSRSFENQRRVRES